MSPIVSAETDAGSLKQSCSDFSGSPTAEELVKIRVLIQGGQTPRRCPCYRFMDDSSGSKVFGLCR